VAKTKALEVAQLANTIEVANGEISTIGTLSSIDISGQIDTSTLQATSAISTANASVTNTLTANNVNLTGEVTSNVTLSRNGSSSLTRVITIGGAQQSDGTDYARLDFVNYDANDASPEDYVGARIAAQNASGAEYGELSFYTSLAGTLGERLTIASSGLVTAKNGLSVVGNLTTSGEFTLSNSVGRIKAATDLELIIDHDNNNIGVLRVKNGAGDTVLTVDESGNTTGIGTVVGKRFEPTGNVDTTAVGLSVYASGAWLNTPTGTSGYLGHAGSGILKWDSDSVDITGDLTVSGDFIISGNTTFVNSDNLQIEDLNIVLASGSANNTVANGAGITIDGANAQITYDGTNDTWNLNKATNISGDINATSYSGGNTSNWDTAYSWGNHAGKYVNAHRSSIIIQDDTYYRAFRVTVSDNNLTSTFRFTVAGDGGGYVAATTFDVIVNHSQDIYIEAASGAYSPITVKIISDNNHNCDVYIKCNFSNTQMLAHFDVMAYNEQTVTFSPTAAEYTGATLEYTTSANHKEFVQSSGNVNIKLDGSIYAAQKIGIGTTSPQSQLYIESAYNDSIRLSDGRSSADANTRFSSAITWDSFYDGAASIKLEHNDYSPAYRRLKFDVSNNNIMALTSSSVGIGTSNPRTKLDVDGIITAGDNSSVGGSVGLAIDYSNGYLTSYGSMYSGGGPLIGYGVRSNGALDKFYSTSGLAGLSRSALVMDDRLRFFTGSSVTANVGIEVAMTERLTVSNTGKVGIGSSDPRTNLDIIVPGANPTATTVTNTTNAKGIFVTSDSNANDMAGIWMGSGSGTHFSGIAGGRTAHTLHWGTHLSFYTHDDNTANLHTATEKVRITGSGNVGIGTTTPNNKLDVKVNSSLVSIGEYNSGAVIWLDGVNGDLVGGDYAAITHNENGLKFHTASLNEAVTISPAANVGIGTDNPQQKLDVNGNIRHTGLTMTDGTDIDQIKTYTKSLTVLDTWTDTGIDSTDLSTGSYMVQVYVENFNVGGGNYYEFYTGVMSWFSNNTNNPYASEIYLHNAGHADGNNKIYLQTQRTYNADTSDLKLQIRNDVSTNGATNYIFKFRRMM